ncbi:amino acid adenylation domain-containing protein [Marinobacter sp.]|uniref:amino acid adenylation domain-containing protein n=1 Tax=Marinobacter sp. TaxID=50741 RepID=UPI0034A569E0
MNTAVLTHVNRHDPFRFGELEGTIESTEAQREVWLAAQFGDDASAAFNESVFLHLVGSVNQRALVAALEALWQRHEAVRSCFSDDGETLVVYKDRPAPVHTHDFLTLSPTDRSRQLSALARDAVVEPFDLFDGPLARFDVIRFDETDTRVLLTLHHSICDGWSLYILASELGSLYERECAPAQPALLEAPSRFGDYAQWERGEETRALREQSIAYWTRRFAGGIPTLDLPYDRPRGLSRSFAAFRLDKPMPWDLLKELKGLAAKNNSTITTTLLAAFAAYLNRISGSEEIVLGIPFAGQMASGEHSLVGHCVNIIPLYLTVSPDDSFRTLLARAQQAMLDAFEHQYLTYGTLLQTLGVARDPSKPPLVSVLFNVDQANESDFRFAGLDTHFESNPRAFENFDLNLNITLSDHSAVMECTHNLQLWNTDTMDRRMDELLLLMRGALEKPDTNLWQLELLRQSDRDFYHQEWAAARCDYDLANHSLHGLIEAATDRFPDRTALIYETGEMSFRELDERANQLAHWLMDRGVGPGTIVPILMDRSPAMLIAINGILKSGGAYLPLDPEHPQDRLAFIVDEVQSGFVLTMASLSHRTPDGTEAIVIDDGGLDLSQMSIARPRLPCTPDQLAYVIYTSGSTGKPKGVMLEHQSICNHMLWMQDTFRLEPSDAVMLKTPYTFDVSLCELFLPLMTGTPLVIANPGGHKDPEYLVELINQHGITHIHFVPSLAYLFLDVCDQARCPSLRRFLLTGEAVSTELETRFGECFPAAECWNLYGPTEAAVHVSSWLCGQESSDFTVSIGKALPNTRLYVVDSHTNLLGQGLVGELLIGGVQVARGYINRPELTAEKFIDDPFSDEPFKAYRTGDLVKMQPDGALEYIGRNDFQVKLRGLRIELGEIESVILRFPGVTQCAVLAREDRKNDQRLVAYIVAKPQLTTWLSELKAHIAETLPDYMLPQHFIQLPALPLTSSGKVDRKSLPPPDTAIADESDYVAPASRLETELCELWSRVLGASLVSVTANFFDLGGHSLLGTQMLAQIKSRYGVSLGLGKLFEAPTVRSLTKRVDQAKQTGERPARIQPAPEHQAVYATPQQQVWYLYEKIVPEAFAFNLPAIFRFRGDLDVRSLEHALDTVLQRHDILRANFLNQDGQVQIVTNNERSISLPPQTLADYGVSSVESLEDVLEGTVATGFDVESDPLFKATLIEVEKQDHILFLMIHHLVFDGWSFDLLLKEMCTLYNAYTRGLGDPLPALPVQFRDYAHWQHQWLESDALESHLAYWKNALGGELPVLHLPLDFERPHTQPHRCKGVKFAIDQATVAALEVVAARQHTTLFTVLMAVYVLMLHRFSRQSDLIVSLPVYARNQDELSGLMGPLINALACRFDLNNLRSIDDLIERVKDTLLSAMEHQEAPFESVVRAINPSRDASRNPVAQTLFNYQDVRNRQDQMEGIERSQINLDRVGVETDLDVWFKRHLHGIEAGFEYPIELFKRTTIEALVTSFTDSIRTITHASAPVLLEPLIHATDPELNNIAAWNETALDCPFEQGFLSEFQRQIERCPDKTACVAGEVQRSYTELDQHSNQLARFLAAQGVKSGEVVALLMERTLDLPATVIALWKLGAAYVPLDPAYPDERIKAILEVAQSRLLLTNTAYANIDGGDAVTVVVLDDHAEAIGQQQTGPVVSSLQPTQLAYIIFTSGSTGVPKGVEVSHGALHNFLMAVAREPGLNDDDRLLAITTLAFDISLLELFLPLTVGATLVIASQSQSGDPHQLKAMLEKEKITALQATPAAWRLLMNAGFKPGSPLKGLIGGEKLPGDLAAVLVDQGIELWNMYGPTEATVWTSCFRVMADPDGNHPRILIGRPLANTQLHVLDDNGNTLPLGVYGELCIGGAGLAIGYRNNPTQTAERFVQHASGERLYRTGDLARWTRDGQIEFGDRIDNQVKVRGYRIELEEIEIQLRTHPAIADAAMVVQDLGADDHRLIAHIVYRGQDRPTSSELRKHLRQFLPDYMMPQQFTTHDQLPLLPSGKVNRKSLAQMSVNPAPARAAHREPTEIEASLMDIWKARLKRDQVALEDQFLDVGGHSLLALQVIVDVEHALGVRLMPQDLWVNTLEQLGHLVDQKRPPKQAPAENTPGKTLFRRLFGSQ